MGNWGIRAHDSDEGLDMLAVADERYLRGMKYKTFHVKHVTELLRSHIVDKFAKESFGWEAEYTDFFYDHTFPYRFAHAVVLVAECFAEYQRKGKYTIYDCKTEKNRRIAEFIFTNKDLESLLTELRSILDPGHSLYESWQESNSFNEWKSHMQTLCGTLLQAISEGGDCHA